MHYYQTQRLNLPSFSTYPLSQPAVFGNMEIHGLNRSVYWSRLSKTAQSGSDVIHLEEIVDWKRGDEIVIAPTSFEPYHTEILKIGKVEKFFVVVVFFRFTVMISILGNLSSSIFERRTSTRSGLVASLGSGLHG